MRDNVNNINNFSDLIIIDSISFIVLQQTLKNVTVNIRVAWRCVVGNSENSFRKTQTENERYFFNENVIRVEFETRKVLRLPADYSLTDHFSLTFQNEFPWKRWERRPSGFPQC